MSKKIPSQDSNFEEVWKEMEEIEPLTPPPPSKKTQLKDAYASYREAALSDGFMFGDYNGYDAYKE